MLAIFACRAGSRPRTRARPRPRARPFAATLLLALAFAGGVGLPEAGARHLPADQVARHLVTVADREWRDWGQTEVDVSDGWSRVLRLGAIETDRSWLPEAARFTVARVRSREEGCHHAEAFDARERLARYWREGLGPDSRPARDPALLERRVRHSAWSAVFVSYLMRQVGLAAEAFPFDAAHSNYLRGLAERAGDADPAAGRRAQFALLLVRETPLAVGDLVCGPRNASHDPGVFSLAAMRAMSDLDRLREAHCDLVVAVDRRVRQARVIGGNVEDSVAMTRIPLTEDGRAIRTLARPWFVLARPQ